jgi:SAM-dependent methyltransferase
MLNLPLLTMLLKCPLCDGKFSHDATSISCSNGHSFPYRGNLIDFSSIGRLNETQVRSKNSFETEWRHYYPRLGWRPQERAIETEAFFTATKAMPNFFFDQIVIDAGCGNGRYINIVNSTCSSRPRLIIGIELSDNAFLAAENCSAFDNVVILKMDLNILPSILRQPVDYIYSIGVLHHTPDAERGFHMLAQCVKTGGFLSVYLYGKGNWVLWRVNSFLRNRLMRHWPPRLVYWLCILVAIPCQVFKIKLVGWYIKDLVTRVIFVSDNVHNMFDAYTAGWTSWHERQQVIGWYRQEGYDCVVDSLGNHTELYCIGRKMETSR